MSPTRIASVGQCAVVSPTARASVLTMHKNTLAYRYNQIRNALQIDPMNNLPDAEFAKNLCYYLEKDEG